MQAKNTQVAKKTTKKKDRYSKFLSPRELFLNFRREKLLSDFWKTTKEEEAFLQARSSESDCKPQFVFQFTNNLFLGKSCGCFSNTGRRKQMFLRSMKQEGEDAHEYVDGVYTRQTDLQ